MSPILLEFWDFKLFAYPLFMGMAWGVGYWGTLGELEERKIPTKGFASLFWGVFLFSWLGAKLLFLINSSGGQYSRLFVNTSFWLGGGFVFYGGLIAGLAYVFFYSKFFRGFDFRNLYLALPYFSMAHGLGRIGCFLAGCCFGSQCSLPWSVHLHGIDRHPVQLYEALALIILGLSLRKIFSKRPYHHEAWRALSFYLAPYSLIRFVLEFYRGDQVRGFWLGSLSSSQVISLILFTIAILINYYYLSQGKKKTH